MREGEGAVLYRKFVRDLIESDKRALGRWIDSFLERVTGNPSPATREAHPAFFAPISGGSH